MPIQKIKQQFKDFYYRRIRRYNKFIPLLGLLILLAIYTSNKQIQPSNVDLNWKEKVINVYNGFASAFIFQDLRSDITTLIIIITLWTGYKYWLVRIRIIGKNALTLQKLVVILIFLIFMLRHVKANSIIGNYLDWAIFLMLLYLTIVGTWFLAKTIDYIDLRSDLYCWGLRLIGGIVAFVGIYFTLTNTLILSLENSEVVTANIWWIIGICLVLLGAFMEYRSVRRHPMIRIW